MIYPTRLLVAIAMLASCISISGCSTSGVQETRASGLDRRQDRMDSRTQARQARWEERGAREDARAAARFDSW